MHNNPQLDDAAKTPPADTVPSATQGPKDAASPIQDAQPAETGGAEERRDLGGVVKVDHRGMVLGFVWNRA
jgi:hypothetical protein